MRYTDERYAKGRIGGTYVFHGERLYLVEDFYDELARLVKTDGGYEEVRIKDIDLTPPHLGYVNLPEASCTCVREALRRDWRQGLRNGNVAIHQYNVYEQDTRVGTQSRRFFKYLERTAQNKYPTFLKAVDSVEEMRKSSAFSRDYSVNEDGLVIRRSLQEIGRVEQDNVLSLGRKFTYLKESLEDILNPQNVRLKLEV